MLTQGETEYNNYQEHSQDRKFPLLPQPKDIAATFLVKKNENGNLTIENHGDPSAAIDGFKEESSFGMRTKMPLNSHVSSQMTKFARFETPSEQAIDGHLRYEQAQV